MIVGVLSRFEHLLAQPFVATATTGEEVMAAVLEHPADVLVLDLGMPGGGVNALLCDGSVQFLQNTMDMLVLYHLANRDDGQRDPEVEDF